MADKNETAASGDSAPRGDAFAGMPDADFDKFMLTGDMPEAPADPAQADTHAEAAAAKPVDQAASTDAKEALAPEAGKPESKAKKLPGQKKSAAERADEIAEENERLDRELQRRRRLRDELERDEARGPKAGKPAEAAAADTAKKDPEWKKYRAMPDAPKSDDFDSLDDYAAAMTVFIADKRAEERFPQLYDERSKADRAMSEREAAFEHTLTETESRVSKELEADPEILDRIDPRWKALPPSERMPDGEKPTLLHWIKDQVTFKSQHTLKLSEKLTMNENAELRRLLAMRDPERILRALAVMDASFDSPGDTAADSDEAADKRPSRVSKAPAPATTLGKKPAPGVDPVKKAIAENDFDTFNALESQRERARA